MKKIFAIMLCVMTLAMLCACKSDNAVSYELTDGEFTGSIVSVTDTEIKVKVRLGSENRWGGMGNIGSGSKITPPDFTVPSDMTGKEPKSKMPGEMMDNMPDVIMSGEAAKEKTQESGFTEEENKEVNMPGGFAMQRENNAYVILTIAVDKDTQITDGKVVIGLSDIKENDSVTVTVENGKAVKITVSQKNGLEKGEFDFDKNSKANKKDDAEKSDTSSNKKSDKTSDSRNDKKSDNTSDSGTDNKSDKKKSGDTKQRLTPQETESPKNKKGN